MTYWVHLVDHWIALILLPLTLAMLVSGVDDLFLNLVYLWTRVRAWRANAVPETRAREPARNRSIAILVPCWHEAGVIVTMVEHNLAVIRYPNFQMFVGVYPNDDSTMRVVRDLEERFPRLHMLVGHEDGPSFKGENLNGMFQALPGWEQRHGVHFDAVMMHDAEDVIHPDALAVVDRYLNDYDMVQIPVLPKLTELKEWTHGIYCDEFAEFQCKDMLVRGYMGSFIPSNGVGTGYNRAVLERLVAEGGDGLFRAGCLTEDYEIGLRLHRMKCRQLFVPLKRSKGGDGDFVATRELFPQTIPKALRQRTRWVTGIALQSWARYGFRGSFAEVYWFWRDRKGLAGNPLSLSGNLVFVAGLLTCIFAHATGQPWGLAKFSGYGYLFQLTVALAIMQAVIRMSAVRWVYGGRFAVWSLPRAWWANWINAYCSCHAMYKYFESWLRGRPLTWAKTEHFYPTRGELRVHQRRLGEILVGSGRLSPAVLDEALAHRTLGMRLGEQLVRSGSISEDNLYEALGVQQSLPVGRLEPAQISRKLARALPLHVMEQWRVLPYRMLDGSLFLASPEVPSDEMNSALRGFTRMSLRFRLVTPGNFEELKMALL